MSEGVLNPEIWKLLTFVDDIKCELPAACERDGAARNTAGHDNLGAAVSVALLAVPPAKTNSMPPFSVVPLTVP